MSKPTWSEEDFIIAIKTSTSIRQVLIKLKLSPKGGSYHTVKKYIFKLNIDISHFSGKSWNKGKKVGPKRPIEDYLSNRMTITSYALKRRLIKEDLFVHKCYKCNLTEWMGNPVPIELEHIDGNHLNNNLSNLTILCPNCHSLTSTYRGKKLKKERISSPCPECLSSKESESTVCYLCMRKSNYKKPKLCNECKVPISDCSFRCKSCASKDTNKNPTKINWPETSELLRMVAETNYCKVAKLLGVSDNSVRKRIKNHPSV